MEWRCLTHAANQHLWLHFLTPGWKEALWVLTDSVSPKNNTASLVNKSAIRPPDILRIKGF